MVAEELLSPIYYFTHGNAYSVTYPGSHGSLTDIEVAINQGEGTQLHAIGERRTPLKATTGFSQESPDEIARWFESLGTGARDLRCANGKSV